MKLDQSMVKIRWLALASVLIMLSVMPVDYIRAWLFLIAAGLLFNLALSMGLQESEFIAKATAVVDLIGIFLAVVFSGGAESIFVVFLAFYVFSVALRFGLVAGILSAAWTSTAFSYFYFTDPTPATAALVLTRVAIFLVAPFVAYLLTANGIPGLKKAREIIDKELEEAEAVSEVVEEEQIEDEEEVKPAKVSKKDKKRKAKKTKAEAKSRSAKKAKVKEEEEDEEDEEEVIELEEEEEKEEAGVYTEHAEDTMPAKVLKEMAEVTGQTEREEEDVLRVKLTELSILHEASKALGSSLIFEEVLDTVADIAIKGMMADIAGALVFDNETQVLKIVEIRGLSSDEAEKMKEKSYKPGEGVFGKVFGKKMTLNIDDISTDKQYSLNGSGRIKSFMATPLSTDGYDIGVLFVGKFLKEPFSGDVEDFIETIAGQAAVAIENARLYAQQQELAIHNGLTGIYNYRYFMKELGEEIKRAERYERQVSLLMIDIDLFKRVNDTHGHQRGDEVLQGLANTLVSKTRETDIVSRYGGEEFAIILPETDMENAMEVATKLKESVTRTRFARKRGKSIKLTISIGVATFPGGAKSQEELLRSADDALYAAKAKRNTVCSAAEIEA